MVFTQCTPPHTSAPTHPPFGICFVWFIPSGHTVQTGAVDVSETFLNLYHTAPCRASNDSNARDVARYNRHSKLPLPVHSIPFASSRDISQSFSALRNRYVTNQ